MAYSKSALLDRMEWFDGNVKLRRCFFGEKTPLPPEGSQITPNPRIILPLNGVKNVSFASNGKIEKQKLLPGDMLFLGTHCWKKPDWSTKQEYISIVFMYKKMLRFVHIDHKGDRERGLCEPDDYYHMEDVSKSCSIRLMQTLELFSAERYPAESALPLCSTLLKFALCELRVSEEKPIGKATHTWHRLSQYVQENFTRRLDRDEVARAINITPEHASLLFRKFGNTTFRAYLNQLRLGHAAYLLHNSDLTIDEISVECGYCNCPYFIKVFRQHYSLPPTMYRNSIDR